MKVSLRSLAGLLVAGLSVMGIFALEPAWRSFHEQRTTPPVMDADSSSQRTLVNQVERNVEKSRRVWEKAETEFAEGEMTKGVKVLIEGKLNYYRDGDAAEELRARAEDLYSAHRFEWIDRLKDWSPLVWMTRFLGRGFAVLLVGATFLFVGVRRFGEETQQRITSVASGLAFASGVLGGAVAGFVLSKPLGLLPTILLPVAGMMLGIVVMMLPVLAQAALILGTKSLRESP